MRASATSSEIWSLKVTQDPKESSLTLTPALPSLRYFIFTLTLARIYGYDEDVPPEQLPLSIVVALALALSIRSLLSVRRSPSLPRSNVKRASSPVAFAESRHTLPKY